MPVKAPAGIRGEIARQQHFDGSWTAHQEVPEARLAAVLGARRAFSEHALGADWALRQSLIDLAAICELLAGEPPPPTAIDRP